MRIVKLEAENVKRLSAVSIEPDGSLVVIGGRHGNGKSSVLDSIMYALAGTDSLPPAPLRTGTDKGQITVTLDGDMIVVRKFSRKKDGDVTTSLEIKRANGDKVASPQALLDSLCGKLAFDPLEFSRQKPKAQLESLKALVSLDFTEVDRERSKAFDRRTDINRQIKAKEAELAARPKLEAPDVEVSVAALVDASEKARKHNESNGLFRRALKEYETDHQHKVNARKAAMQRVDELKGLLADAENAVAQREREEELSVESLADYREKVAALADVDTSDLADQIAKAEKTNNAVRSNAARAKLAQAEIDLVSDADALTDRIGEIDKSKEDALAAAKFPVDGLSFGTDGVLLHGLPLEQACTADRIRLSVAMGLALNPKLRVMLIREGSLLFDDETGLRLIAEMAEAADAQVWVERVSLGAECSVIISDGMVLEREAVEEKELVGA